MRTHPRTVWRVLPLVICLAGAGIAAADISNVIFHFEAENAGGSGSFEATSNLLSFNPVTGVYSWGSMAPMDLVDPNTHNVIATLRSVNLAIVDQPGLLPRITMNWSAAAGGSLTTFNVFSALVSYSTIPAAQGKATVSLSATDQTGDGVTLSGLDPQHGLGIYTAKYNGANPGEGTMFSNLLSLVAAGPGGTGQGSQNDPSVGFRPIGADVFSMTITDGFTLTAGDLMSGNNSFVVLPEPASLLLLAGLLVGLRRR
jgi:hypothetical protein